MCQALLKIKSHLPSIIKIRILFAKFHLSESHWRDALTHVSERHYRGILMFRVVPLSYFVPVFLGIIRRGLS